MSEQIAEKKQSQDFLESEKYAVLKKEVVDSMASIDITEIGESDRDIAPVFDYFEKEVVKSGLSEIKAEKLFWQTVVEQIQETRFRDIYYTIRPDIENKEYSSARRVLMEELNKIVEQLSHTLYANLSRKSSALVVLKERFYDLFPEIESLIEETEEEKRAKMKIPAGQLGKEDDEMPPPSEGEFREGFRNPYLVEERDWKVPDHGELVTGLVITFLNKKANSSETIELLDMPRLGKDGDFFVKVKWNGATGKINLADFGILAYAQTSLWNSHYIPIHWKMKEKK